MSHSMILLTSISSITLSMVLYTIGVWRNWRTKLLTGNQLAIFVAALGFDLLGTRMMGMLVEGDIVWDFHTISGYTGLGLMVILVVTGSFAFKSKKKHILTSFHKFALPIWVLWMTSYMSGIVVGLQRTG